MRTTILTTIALMLCSLSAIMTSCISEEDFPTPASARLRFSVDTLNLDTVLTHTSSATRKFTIYNDNSDGVSISAVAFEGVGKDNFLANVDGTFINAGINTPIDCRAKDSLIAFVQFNAQDNDNDDAIMSEAKLVFTLANGASQSIVVKGYSQDAIILKGKVITSDTTITSKRPFIIYDSLHIANGATLTIAAGSTLLFHPDAFMRVDGTLIAQGAQDKPIIFRGDRYDDMFKNQAYDQINNQWQGITFTSNSYNNKLNYCDIHSGKWGIYCDSSDVSKIKLRLENSIVHNVKQDALRLVSSQVFVGNSQISNAEGNCLTIYGGDAMFIHCTIASFSPFTALRGNALVFSNYLNKQPYPIQRLAFYNSIVTGYASDEIFAYTSDDKSIANNYSFNNCLLNTPEITDNPSVMNNVWDNSANKICRDANFVPFNLVSLIYSFRLAADSPARSIADPTITNTYYPFDRLGVSRNATLTPADAGCYQFQQDK